MEMDPNRNGNWQTNALITLGVIATVMMALLLTQSDILQIQFQSPSSVLTFITAVPPAFHTPVVIIPLQDITATMTPPTTTPSNVKPRNGAVAVLPTCGQIPAGWVSITVRPGDTLFSLSLQSGATIEEIQQANCLELSKILEGATLYLPSFPPSRPPCGPPDTWVQYVVQRGDTMFSLARVWETTLYAIVEANCLHSSYLRAGQVIYLPLLLTPTATNTVTTLPSPPTVTATGTAVPTLTMTTTPSPSPTPTMIPISPTVSATPSTTATAVPATTVTITATVTNTSTPTPSATPTLTFTPSATPTHSATPTPSPSNTATPTATPLPTATDTAVPTQTPTP